MKKLFVLILISASIITHDCFSMKHLSKVAGRTARRMATGSHDKRFYYSSRSSVSPSVQAYRAEEAASRQQFIKILAGAGLAGLGYGWYKNNRKISQLAKQVGQLSEQELIKNMWLMICAHDAEALEEYLKKLAEKEDRNSSIYWHTLSSGLFLAVHHNDLEMARLFLEKFGQNNRYLALCNKQGNTVFDIATQNKNDTLIKLLQEYGAGPSQTLP